MVETTDQVFVTAKHWLVALLPHQCQPFFSAFLSAAAIVVVFATLFGLTTLLGLVYGVGLWLFAPSIGRWMGLDCKSRSYP